MWYSKDPESVLYNFFRRNYEDIYVSNLKLEWGYENIFVAKKK